MLILVKGASLVLAVIYLSAFIYVHYEHEKRVQLLKQQIKDHPRQEVYTVESLPFHIYTHYPSPINKNYQEWFNNYEELPKMTKVNIFHLVQTIDNLFLPIKI